MAQREALPTLRVRRQKPPNECKQFSHNGDRIDTTYWTAKAHLSAQPLRLLQYCCERNERSPQTLVDN